jgi:hypothetical protein
MAGLSNVSARVQNIVLAVIFIIIGIVGMVVIANAVAGQVGTIQDTSVNVSENLTNGDWGSDTANSLSSTMGELTPLAFLGWTIGLVLFPLGTGIFFAVKALKGV